MVDYLVNLTIFVSIYSLFALGLNLQWGYTGLINFGPVAFMTIGAYTTALLTLQGLWLPAAVAIGAVLASVLGLVVGTSTLRLREDYLAIVTIGVSELVRLVALNEEWLTRGPFGVQRYPKPLADVEPNMAGNIAAIALLSAVAIFALWLLYRGIIREWRHRRVQKQWESHFPKDLAIWAIVGAVLVLMVYVNGAIALWDSNFKSRLMLVLLVILALTFFGLEVWVRSPWGRVLKSIREDEEIPRALGKNVFWYKMQSFMLGGAIAGVAGAFYAWQLGSIYPDNFQPLLSFSAWTVVVLGGAGNNAGVVLGAVIFWAYDALTRFLDDSGLINLDESRLGALRIMIIGLILMVLMVWRPQGILGKKEELTLGR